eukprot:2209810-Prymnesium_polylepis.1
MSSSIGSVDRMLSLRSPHRSAWHESSHARIVRTRFRPGAQGTAHPADSAGEPEATRRARQNRTATSLRCVERGRGR